MKVVLAVGHKEISPGACNNAGLCEWSINNKLIDELIRKNDGNIEFIKVLRKSYDKLPYEIDRLECDIVIEFHCNSSDKPLATGTETLYPTGCESSKQLAALIQHAMVASLGLKDRGSKAIAHGDRGGYLLHTLKTRPCVITEPFFLSNKLDNAAYQANKDEMADRILVAIYQMGDILNGIS